MSNIGLLKHTGGAGRQNTPPASLRTHLLTTKGVVGSDHLAHEHGRRHHDGATGHWSRHQLGHQLLTCGEPGDQAARNNEQKPPPRKTFCSWAPSPDLPVLREGGHGGALLCIVLRQSGADLQHVGLARLRDHHSVVEGRRDRTLRLGRSLRRRRRRRLRLALRLQAGNLDGDFHHSHSQVMKKAPHLRELHVRGAALLLEQHLPGQKLRIRTAAASVAPNSKSRQKN